MKKTTINDAIKILKAAKKEFGGDTTFVALNNYGDFVSPTKYDLRIGIRGNKQFEEVYLR